MGDVRFDAPYREVAQAHRRHEVIAAMPDADLVAALGGASREGDRLTANVLATALQNRVQQLHKIIDNLGEGVILLDRGGRAVFLNPGAFRLLGWTLEDLKARPVHDAVHPHCGIGADCPIVSALTRPTESQDNEATFVRADSAPLPVAFTITSLETDGEVSGAVLLVRDLSEHRRAVEATARLATVIAASHDAIYMLTPSGTITSWNAAAEKLYGWACAEILGQDVGVLFPPEAGRERDLILDMVLREGSGMTFESTRQRKNGTLVDVSISITPMKDNKTGDIVGMSVSARDISARKRDEQLLRSVLEAAPTAMVVSDEAGRIILANARAEALFGYGSGELVWHEVEELVPSRLRGVHRLHRASYQANPHARPMGAGLELWGVRKDGSEFPVEISLSPAPAREGGPGHRERFVTVAAIREAENPGSSHPRPGPDPSE